MQLKIKKMYPDVKTPTYATEGAACFDIYNYGSKTDYDGVGWLDPTIFTTGLQFEVPQDHVMLVFSRSGHGFNNNIRLANCVGVIDSDYRGELMVKLTKDTQGAYAVGKGDRIAQAMVIPVKQVEFLEVDELSDTKRGANGLGSTGVK